MESAAASPEAAVRFLVFLFLLAIGYDVRGVRAVPVQKLGLSLAQLTAMTMLDLERKLGVSPKKAVVALYDECMKLLIEPHHPHCKGSVASVRPFIGVCVRCVRRRVRPARSRSSRAVACRVGVRGVLWM
jgi:hypothetical protein